MALETYILEMMEGRRKGRALLYGLSQLYRFATSLRNMAYDRKWLKGTRVDAFVISVGNIVCGGTGKTPLVCLLAKEFSEEGKVAIATRGYRSSIEAKGENILISSKLDPKECGDEPHWLASQLERVSVWVGKDRCKSARLALLEGARLILLDDGMQHRRLERDLEIIVIDGKDPFGKGYPLPRGLLREMPKSLSRAQLIVINHVESSAHYEEVVQQIAPYSSAPTVGVRMKLKEGQLSLGERVGVFCGIGKPERFIEGLKRQGAVLVEKLILPDHASVDPALLEIFCRRCKEKGGVKMVCTEKDFVKLPASLPTSLPIVPLKASIEFVAGAMHWQELVRNVKRELLVRALR